MEQLTVAAAIAWYSATSRGLRFPETGRCNRARWQSPALFAVRATGVGRKSLHDGMVHTALAVVMVSLLAGASDLVAEPTHRHTAYVDVLGKGGLYSVGYDYSLTRRLQLGAAVSAYSLDDERVLTVSPYLGVRIIGGHRHSWFTQVGPRLANQSVRSPAMRWNGPSRTGVAGQLSSGYEYRRRVVLRVYAMTVAGSGGVVPWAGTSVGVAF